MTNDTDSPRDFRDSLEQNHECLLVLGVVLTLVIKPRLEGRPETLVTILALLSLVAGAVGAAVGLPRLLDRFETY
ncbi:hypothetical protein ZOD2009_13271 [Haladaptatus paucihalophilus DX253]|uniref:Uncharacterized protein n=1 Tax=Haladaptatus paucihalophilus DX253 TaxID=797209 RepID=E7QV18_HALPU|nr:MULTISPECIES: hypothetical protein [Haladaptatus]EFW91536.1 hypothetical protein ZOD2009_13271 [Haladaptatus paucihalophilus DX253]ODR80628.1 hypothetical protein BG842_03680 [Haladaptatus sp. W1]GKZ16191.1 hypothetical protein HAL_40720 [Haladaptatus sp. T7]SHL25350.1 hypothetical protein SAMN05444342_3427 [Haladaptatus paucihalophilus DX253]